MHPGTLEQIDKLSNRVLFQFNLQSGSFDYLSSGVSKLWEQDVNELKQYPELLLKNIHENDIEALKANFEQVKKGDPRRIEFSLKLSDDTLKNIEVDAYPIRDETQAVTAIAGMVEDVTQQVKYETYLVEFGRKKNSMLEIVLHDLQGPLAIVQSVAHALEHDHESKIYNEIPTYTQFINNACKNSMNLISELLTEEHLRSPDISVKRERINIVAELKSLIASYKAGSTIKQEIELVANEETIVMEVDVLKLMQVTNNLISNSIKFTQDDGRITISVSKEGRNLLIVHKDNGIGIPENLQPYLFDKYTSASRTGLRGEKSMGIGMSIVRDLVEVQGGKIWFESKEGEGTTFFISLPQYI